MISRPTLLKAARAGIVIVLAACALAAVVGLFGFVSGWLDAAAHFAPILLWPFLACVALVALTPSLRRSRLVWAPAAVGAAAFVALLAPDALNAVRAGRERAAPNARDTVVVSMNLWDGSADHRPALRAIGDTGADVVTLQEALAPLHQGMPELRDRYPYSATCGQWWGCELVILSRRPILEAGWLRANLKSPYRPWILWARTTGADGRVLTVVTTHLGQPLPPRRRAEQQAALLKALKPLAPTDLVLTGDLNAPGSAWSLRRLDGALEPLQRRTLALPTWPDRAPGGLRFPAALLALDHVYAGPAWRTVEVKRLMRTQSDHRGVLVRLSRTPGR